MTEDIHIAGLLVHARPELVLRVQENIEALEGAEVLTATQSGKMVVTLESDSSAGIVQTMAAIGDVYGVVSTSLVYEHHEPVDIRIKEGDFGPASPLLH